MLVLLTNDGQLLIPNHLAAMMRKRAIDILSILLLSFVLPGPRRAVKVGFRRLLVLDNEPLRDADDFVRLSIRDFGPRHSGIHVFVEYEAARVQFLGFWVQIVGPAGVDEAVGVDGLEHERGKLREICIFGDERVLERHGYGDGKAGGDKKQW